MVASDHTTMKEVAPSMSAPPRIIQGFAIHLYIIMCGCTGLIPVSTVSSQHFDKAEQAVCTCDCVQKMSIESWSL